MATLEIEKKYKEPLKVVCPKCLKTMNHEVIVSALHSAYEDDIDMHWWVRYQTLRCLGCDTFSFREASTDSDSMYRTGPDSAEYIVTETLHPPRLANLQGLDVSNLQYLNKNIRKIYKETMGALRNGQPILAGIGLRAIVESVCKEKGAQGNDLQKQITWLRDTHVLTPVNADILHGIRSMGNKAAHEVTPHSEDRLGLAMDVIDNMLKDVFILPARANAQLAEHLPSLKPAAKAAGAQTAAPQVSPASSPAVAGSGKAGAAKKAAAPRSKTKKS